MITCMNKKLSYSISIALIVFGAYAYMRTAKAPAEVVIPDDRIRIAAPITNALVSSPLAVSGEARGMWYFEASFPLALLDANRNTVAEWYAQADGEWMTEDFVPFSGSIEFTAPATDIGYLVFKKDNPSGLSEHDASVEIPVRFR